MFTVVAMTFQQIMAELKGAESEEDRNGYHRSSIKTYEAKWPLDFIGDKYDCAVEGHQQL
jgi:hypothetical protein